MKWILVRYGFLESVCTHKQYDKRQPGLFKLEFAEDKMISLCSKSYIVMNGEEYKMSTKGINKNRVQNPCEKFEEALKNQKNSFF